MTRARIGATFQRPDRATEIVQIAILRALDGALNDLRGVRSLPLSEAVRHWMRAQSEFDLSVPLFRRWELALTQQHEADAATLTDIAWYFDYVDVVGNVDTAALVATVRRWVRLQQTYRRRRKAA